MSTTTTNDLRRPGPRARNDTARIGGLAVFLAGILAVSCVPTSSNPVDSAGPAPGTVEAGQLAAPAPQGTPEEAPVEIAEKEPADSETKTRGRSFESEDLFGLGEIGLLPAVLQSFGTTIDCDFDDALSTCQ